MGLEIEEARWKWRQGGHKEHVSQTSNILIKLEEVVAYLYFNLQIKEQSLPYFEYFEDNVLHFHISCFVGVNDSSFCFNYLIPCNVCLFM